MEKEDYSYSSGESYSAEEKEYSSSGSCEGKPQSRQPEQPKTPETLTSAGPEKRKPLAEGRGATRAGKPGDRQPKGKQAGVGGSPQSKSGKGSRLACSGQGRGDGKPRGGQPEAKRGEPGGGRPEANERCQLKETERRGEPRDGWPEAGASGEPEGGRPKPVKEGEPGGGRPSLDQELEAAAERVERLKRQLALRRLRKEEQELEEALRAGTTEEEREVAAAEDTEALSREAKDREGAEWAEELNEELEREAEERRKQKKRYWPDVRDVRDRASEEGIVLKPREVECRWCAQQVCWSHGQVDRPWWVEARKAKQRAAKKRRAEDKKTKPRPPWRR